MAMQVIQVGYDACMHCGGSGQQVDDRETGKEMRRVRLMRGMSLRDMARRAEWSAAYLCDLELGRRRWTQPAIDKYSSILGLEIKYDHD